MAGIIKTDEELDELRDNSYLSIVKKGYKVFKGCTLPKCFEDIQKEIEDLEVYDDDIWVTSFPKCGTTWTQEMVWCICNNVDLEAAKVSLMDRYNFLEFGCIGANLLCDIDFGENNTNALKNLKRPRFIKSHLPWELLPKQIRNFEKRPKIIHVMRNPKDTCVSFYHHHKILECYCGDFELFWQLFLKNKIFWTSFTSTVISYWNKRSEPNVLLLKFEDMKQDLMGAIKETSEFLNVDLSEDQMTKLFNHLGFDAFKKNDAVNRNDLVEYMKSKNLVTNKDGEFMRKGIVGDYKSLMTPEIIALFDKEIGTVLNNVGLKL